jgi:hypothetical protein
MNPVATLGISLLLVWFVISILAQFNLRWIVAVRSWDILCMIPAWTFFAPRPGTTDTNLLYRDQLIDGTITPWRTVTTQKPGTLRWIWNPYRRRRKCLFDMSQNLQLFAAATRSVERIVLDVAYIDLLTFVSRLPRNSLHVSTQFLLAYTPGPLKENQPQILFISGFHPLS